MVQQMQRGVFPPICALTSMLACMKQVMVLLRKEKGLNSPECRKLVGAMMQSDALRQLVALNLRLSNHHLQGLLKEVYMTKQSDALVVMAKAYASIPGWAHDFYPWRGDILPQMPTHWQEECLADPLLGGTIIGRDTMNLAGYGERIMLSLEQIVSVDLISSPSWC